MNVDGTPYLTIWLADDGRTVKIIDQTRLPHEFIVVELKGLQDACKKNSDNPTILPFPQIHVFLW